MERKKKMEKRRGSYGNVEEMLKRNWGGVREERGKEREEEGIFRRSKKDRRKGGRE